jgi:hypothetical protein
MTDGTTQWAEAVLLPHLPQQSVLLHSVVPENPVMEFLTLSLVAVVTNLLPPNGVQPLKVYTGQSPRQRVVLIEIQPNAYNNYLSQTAGVITFFWGDFLLYI